MGHLIELIPVFGALFGQILHIVKKKTEEEPGVSEASIFTRWVLRRPANTLAATLVGLGASVGLGPAELTGGVSLLQQFLQAVTVGIAANSMINRPGE